MDIEFEIANELPGGEPVSRGAKGTRKSPEEKLHDKVSSLLEIWQSLPHIHESQHIISDGTFDFYSFVLAAMEIHPEPFDEMHMATWLMNMPISQDIAEKFATGRIRGVTIIAGKYIRQRTPSVYGFLQGEAARPGFTFKTGRNHSKIILLRSESVTLTIQASANITENPRTEQFVVTTHPDVYGLHKKWMNEFIW